MDDLFELSSINSYKIVFVNGTIITETFTESINDSQYGSDKSRRMILKKIKEYIGGYIEIIRILYNEKNFILICNDNGLALGLKLNYLATNIHNNLFKTNGIIVGNCILCHESLIL